MKITKQELINLGACRDGLNRFIKQTDNTEGEVEISSLVGGLNSAGDLLWLAGKISPKEKIIRFACDCALINIELIKPYAKDFNLIVDFLKKPSDAAYAAAADDAAYAAADDAYAAYAAADAAAAAADADADDAAYAAAAAAAYAAADAAADAKEKIEQLLIELFKGE